MKIPLFLLVCAVGLAGCSKSSDSSQTTGTTASGTPASDMTSTSTTQPNNTGINTRDRAPGAITAGVQGQGKSDVDITADIRRRVMDGKMSVAAQNVKIISMSGKVTLRGPVNTQDERDSIGRMANDVAGQDNVDNQLEIKAQ